MKNYKKMKIFTAFLFVFVVALVGFPSISSAAVVGESLTTPEAGWSRFDDTNPRIIYNGVFQTNSGFPNVYNGTGHWVNFNAGQSVEFKFVGTKLRIFDARNSSASSEMNITIDGITESYSQYVDIPLGQNQRQTLLYEKVGLTYKEHTVRIESIHSGGWGLDAIDIDDNGYLVNPTISSPVLSVAEGPDSIHLNWSIVTNAAGYNVKRAITSGGPYETISTSVTGSTYSDVSVIPGITYYYVVTAMNARGEGTPSNIATATIPIPDDGRAILVITLTSGLEKEYDLSMQEVNDFINWYEAKQEGTGKASYAINKHDNNKGPFKSRKDYILFDRILTFEVSEY